MLNNKLEKLRKEASRIKGLSRSFYNTGNSTLGHKLHGIHTNISLLVDDIEQNIQAGEYTENPQLTMGL